MQTKNKILAILIIILSPCFTKAQVDSSFVKDAYYKKLVSASNSLPVFYNANIKAEIIQLSKQSSRSASLLGKIDFAVKNLGPYFDSLGLPKELAILAVANSQLNPNYVDPETGASGIWPLSYSVAKRHKLITNSFVDQRRNMFLSAQVVAKYMQDLEKIYQNWHLSITAFYAGPINLNMAIRKAGNSLNYPAIHEVLDPKQQKCIENFMSLLYLYYFHNEHKISPEKYFYPQTDTICSNSLMSLDLIADKLEIKRTTMTLINAEFIEGVVPKIENCNCFHLPTNKILDFVALREEMLQQQEEQAEANTVNDSNSSEPVVIAETGLFAPPEQSITPKNASSSNEPKLIYYTIKNGDNLGLLSKLFDCSINDIKRWNNMHNNTLYAGKKLKLYVKANKLDQYRKINNMSASQKQALARSK